MKFKLDENLGNQIKSIFEKENLKVSSIREEKLSGCSDIELYKFCKRNGYCLVTFDLDFSDIIRFPSRNTQGIIILRPHKTISFSLLKSLTEVLLKALKEKNPRGETWIVEIGRIRIKKSE